jgi:hypothetical protein
MRDWYGEKGGTWQEKEVEYINKLVYGKDIKKIWKAVRMIVRGKEPTAYVEPNEWVSHFQDLFSRDSNRVLAEVYEMQMIGPLYIEELDRDFTKREVKELALRMKNNIFVIKATIGKYLRFKRGQLYWCFVDLEKAFDSIDRETLWYKLRRKWISDKMVECIRRI